MTKFFLVSLLIFNFSFSQENNLENFHQVSTDLYRSAQPNKYNTKFIEQQGIKSLLNLRYFSFDKKHSSNLIYFKEGINSWTLTETDIVNALRIIKNAPKPILIHCKHGSDRTGTIIAAYHVVVEGWSKEKAIAELLLPEYGFHGCFQNMIFLLEHLNVERVKYRILND